MSVYEKENPSYLEEALLSMLNQSISPEEIVLVEDGPLTSELNETIDSFSSARPELFTIAAHPRIMVRYALSVEYLRAVTKSLLVWILMTMRSQHA